MATETPDPILGQSQAPAVDPTRNVLDLVAAAIQRQDDLRSAESRHVREIADIRAECARDERAADMRIADLRAEHDRELRRAEAARIDAIRAVDVGAVQRAAEVQAQQATALATQATALAETLRTQVAVTANAQTAAWTAALEPLQKRIEDLSRAQYEAQGQKAQVVESRSVFSSTAAVAIGVGGLLLTVIVAVVGVIIGTQ